jgi:hypothetical protein
MGFRNKLIATVFLPAILSACGDGGSLGGGQEDGGNPSYKVVSFNVAGTSTDNDNGAAPISPTVNSGQFGLRWQVQDLLGDHPVSAFVSADGKLSSGDDILFYTETCESDDPDDPNDSAADCGSSNPYTKLCTFNNSDEIFCDDQAGDVENLMDFLSDGVPKDAFIIFQACAAAGSPCRTASHAVQFQ